MELLVSTIYKLGDFVGYWTAVAFILVMFGACAYVMKKYLD